MRFPAFVAAGCLLFGAVGSAHAQVVEGPGIKLGESTVLRPVVGLESGFISNVFYTESNPVSSPVLRGSVSLSVATTEREDEGDGAADIDTASQPKVEFNAGLRLKFEEYVGGDDNLSQQRNLGVGADLRTVAFPSGAVSFVFTDAFIRATRPQNFESTGNLNRDINNLKLELAYRPGGKALRFGFRYKNTLDVFESDEASSGNRMLQTIGARADWKFLPITSFHADASFGFFGQLGDATLSDGTPFKMDSNPIRVQVGAASAITELTTIRLGAGYGKADYDERTGQPAANFAGFIGGAELGYRYSPMGRLSLSYQRSFEDSLNANYYSEDGVAGNLDHQIDRVLIRVGVGVKLRTYDGVPLTVAPKSTREDTILDGVATARYIFRDWWVFTARYRYTDDATDDLTAAMVGGVTIMDDPSYKRHELFLSGRAAF